MTSPRCASLLFTLMRANSREIVCSDNRLTICRTSKTLRSCSTRCSTPTAESFITTVRRIISGSSLRPIVHVCIVARRRRSTFMMRSSAPCRSFTSTTNVCKRPEPSGALDWPARSVSVITRVLLHRFFDHVGNGCTGNNHWIHIRLRLNDEINNYRSLLFHCLVHSGCHIFAFRDTYSGQSVGRS